MEGDTSANEDDEEVEDIGQLAEIEQLDTTVENEIEEDSRCQR